MKACYPIFLFFLIFSYENVLAQSTDTVSLQFRKQMIAAESFESVGVFDINNDGYPDIVSGRFWYEGPDFWVRHFIGEITYSEHEYWDDFCTIPLDVNGDGLIDFITGSVLSSDLRWWENPGDHSQWVEHIITPASDPMETARAWDVDGDGYPEIVPNSQGPLKVYKLDSDENDIPLGSFTAYTIAGRQGHGLGFGDINGNGKGDFVLSKGWLEAPDDPLNDKWTLHEEFNLGTASVPILVVDVNGDGKNDLIVGQAHSYGLDWYEQSIDEFGNRIWIKHSIDSTVSQFHTMEWADLDGDDQGELITGKRYRGHSGNDPGSQDPIGLFYYKWNGESFDKQTIAYGPLGVGKGTGIYFSVADLRETGRTDIVVAGKDGLYVFFNGGFDE